MSEWTHVRIIYDVQKKLPSNAKDIEYEEFSMLDIRSLFESANASRNCPKIHNLGESGVTLSLIANDSSIMWLPFITTTKMNDSLHLCEKGHLVIVGNIRGMTPSEFIPILNDYRVHLRNYGIAVISGTVKIT